jgi:hypothetical protein
MSHFGMPFAVQFRPLVFKGDAVSVTALAKMDSDESSPKNAGRLAMWFIHSAGVILLVTGLAKIYSSVGEAKVLEVIDPIFRITFRQLMVATGMIELVVACFCFFNHSSNFRLAAVVWISASFLLYRGGLWSMHWRRPCPCLGTLTDQFHISTDKVDSIMLFLASYLFFGSIFCCLFLRKRAAAIWSASSV